MKKAQLILFIFLILYVLPVEADTKYNSMEDLLTYMNLSGELLYYMEYATGSSIDIKSCRFLINSSDSGLYTCPINASTTLHVYTDKYMKPDMIVIAGPLDNQGLPKKTTFDWAMAALFAVIQPDNLYYQDLLEIYSQSLKTGFYEDEYNYVICGSDYESNQWHYIITNK